MANTERHHGADLAKWLGLVLMVLDHAWYVVPAEWQDVYGWVRVPGRLAFPIFCCVIAINVMRSPRGDLGSFKRNGYTDLMVDGVKVPHQPLNPYTPFILDYWQHRQHNQHRTHHPHHTHLDRASAGTGITDPVKPAFGVCRQQQQAEHADQKQENVGDQVHGKPFTANS